MWPMTPPSRPQSCAMTCVSRCRPQLMPFRGGHLLATFRSGSEAESCCLPVLFPMGSTESTGPHVLCVPKASHEVPPAMGETPDFSQTSGWGGSQAWDVPDLWPSSRCSCPSGPQFIDKFMSSLPPSFSLSFFLPSWVLGIQTRPTMLGKVHHLSHSPDLLF
jgi:hypothetical protein